MNPYTLENKTILVTEAASAIGRQIAIECSKLGAIVIAQDKNHEVLLETMSLLCGDGHRMVDIDLDNEIEIADFVTNCENLDGLSLNRNISTTALLKFVNANSLNTMLETNVIGPILILQKLVKAKKFNKNASIVYLSSVSGVFTVHYADSMNAMTNGAISAFVKGAALDLAAQGIRVNSVNPSVIETPELLESSILTDEELNEKRNYFPLKRFGSPIDVALPVTYLLSDASSWITGVHLPIDGGYTLL